MAQLDRFADITRTIETYVKGMVLDDAVQLREAFHPKACCIGHFNDGLDWLDREALIAEIAGVAPPDGAPYWQINGIDISGDTAVVQVENDLDGMRYDDTLILLYHEGRWQIVSKVFYLRPS